MPTNCFSTCHAFVLHRKNKVLTRLKLNLAKIVFQPSKPCTRCFHFLMNSICSQPFRPRLTTICCTCLPKWLSFRWGFHQSPIVQEMIFYEKTLFYFIRICLFSFFRVFFKCPNQKMDAFRMC